MLFTYLDLSTGHLMRSTIEHLEVLAQPDQFDSSWPAMTIASYPNGFFVTVPTIAEPEQIAALPVDLVAVIAHARQRGAALLRFDSDGEQVDGLPFYE